MSLKEKNNSKSLKKKDSISLKVKKEFILPLLSQVQSLLEKRGVTLPVFSNVFIKYQEENRAEIHASDSELSFSASFPAKVNQNASFAINGKKLFEIVKELKNDFFEINSSNKSLNIEIKQESSRFKIYGLNTDDYPILPTIKQKNKKTLLVGELSDIIDKTLYCVSSDESRYHLTGVFLEQLNSFFRFVATDGHRMSFLDVPVDEEKKEFLKKGIIIPKKALYELKKMIHQGESQDKIEFFIENPRLLVKFKNQSLNIRLIEGQYPNYKQLIPKSEGKKIQINRLDFLSALKRISVLTSARFKGVNFTFSKVNLVIDFSHPEVGEASEELKCKSSDEEIKVRFNSQYILDILQSIQEDNVLITLIDNRSPGLLQPEGGSPYTCLVMPMKI